MKNVLFIDKPSGISSFDVCFRLRKVLHTRKIGHTGTLDPLATGVMVVLFDKATKANQFLVSDSKEYIASVKTGIVTDSLDIDGNVIREEECEMPDWEKIDSVMKGFLGTSLQEVPLTSAVSVDGKRLYRYQLEGREVELPKRNIEVSDIELLVITDDVFTFRTRVSSGTYIRALARDILDKLNICGTVISLRRTAVDDIRVEECDRLEEIEKGNYTAHDLFELLSKRYRTVDYPDPEVIKNGKRIKLEEDADRVLICHNNEALAIYEKDHDEYKTVRGLW